MKKPVPPSNFLTRDSNTQVDLRRLRDAWQDLLNWIDANKSSVDLSAYDTITGNNARYLLRAAADFATFAAKATPVGADVLLIEDSAAAGAKKKATLNTLATAIGAAVQIGGSNPLWATPATLGLSAGAADMEFDSTTLPGSMTIWDSTAGVARSVAGNTVLRGTTPGNNLYADAHTTAGGRASWLRMQAPGTNQLFVVFPVTVPSSVIYWTRMKYFNNSGISAGFVRFTLMGATGGHPDPQNRVSTGLSNNMANLFTESILANASQAGSANGDSISRANAPPEYFWIEKDGSTSPATYILYAASADGTAFVSQQVFLANTFTPAYVGFHLLKPSAGVVSNVLHRFDVDFIRQTTSPQMF